MPAKVFNDTIFNYNFSFNGNDYNYSFMDIIGNRYGDYKITEGSSPQNINEIAITQNVRETFGMDIGDTIEVDFDGEKEKCTVTGIFNCMNNMGNQIRLYDDAPTKMSHYIGSMSVQISFTDNPSQEEINSRRDRIKEILDTEDVKNKKDATVENMATLDAMEAVEKLLMAITVIVVILVTVMMERSFIAKETKQIAILKAMGFRDSEVIKWQVIRFAVLAVIAVVIAIALSVPATKLAIGSVFNMIGASKIDWIFDFRSMAKYPAVLVAITVVITWITAQYTGTVKARDTASIE